MSYFSLRKREPEPEPEETEEEPEETVEEEEVDERERPAKQYGPLLTGLLGPGQWLAARFGTSAASGVYVVAVWAVSFYGGWIAAGVALVWLAAVLAFVPREHLEQLADRVEKRGSETADDTPPTPTGEGGRDGILTLLYSLLGEAHAVHLKTVLAHLQEHGQWEGKTVADLRQHLEALGIPVQPKVKVGKIPTRGVLKADLDALPPIGEIPPSPAPSPAV
ncbi:hypothetical protein ACWD25_04050 [Streptomyces sp. NPDC002920]